MTAQYVVVARRRRPDQQPNSRLTDGVLARSDDKEVVKDTSAAPPPLHILEKAETLNQKHNATEDASHLLFF